MSDTKPLSHADRRERRRQIALAIKAGKPVGETARKFEVTTEQVRRACIENGVRLIRMTVAAPSAA